MKLNRTLALFASAAIVLVLPTILLAAAHAPDVAHAHVADVAHAADAHGADAHKANLPGTINEGLITAITSLIVFILLFAILSKAAWGPIAKGLAAREAKIREDIAIAERARAEGEAALANYKSQIANADAQVREKLATAQKDAEAIATRLKMDAQKEIEESKVRATREIEDQKNAALAEVRQHAASLSSSIASKILKRQINENDQADLIRSSLEELQVSGRR